MTTFLSCHLIVKRKLADNFKKIRDLIDADFFVGEIFLLHNWNGLCPQMLTFSLVITLIWGQRWIFLPLMIPLFSNLKIIWPTFIFTYYYYHGDNTTAALLLLLLQYHSHPNYRCYSSLLLHLYEVWWTTLQKCSALTGMYAMNTETTYLPIYHQDVPLWILNSSATLSLLIGGWRYDTFIHIEWCQTVFELAYIQSKLITTMYNDAVVNGFRNWVFLLIHGFLCFFIP